jgi:hypothetical protein
MENLFPYTSMLLEAIFTIPPKHPSTCIPLQTKLAIGEPKLS